jgi:hypothetical protein
MTSFLLFKPPVARAHGIIFSWISEESSKISHASTHSSRVGKSAIDIRHYSKDCLKKSYKTRRRLHQVDNNSIGPAAKERGSERKKSAALSVVGDLVARLQGKLPLYRL